MKSNALFSLFLFVIVLLASCASWQDNSAADHPDDKRLVLPDKLAHALRTGAPVLIQRDVSGADSAARTEATLGSCRVCDTFTVCDYKGKCKEERICWRDPMCR